MADSVVNYQCPNCDAPLKFSPESGEVKCEYCGSSFPVAVLEKLYNDSQMTDEDVEWGDVTPGTAWDENEESSFQVYSCPSCGAEIICDENTISTSCVYCGNQTILNGRLSGTLKPDYIIPFKKTKEDAVAALTGLYKGKKLLPKAFKNQNHIEEIKAVYVPFWLFDSGVEARIVYDATRSNVVLTDEEEITTIRHYRAMREGEMHFNKIPVDGSTKMEDRYMDAIEPFNYDDLVPFAKSYLPGYLAEKYDVDAEESTERVSERIFNSIQLACERTLSYDTHSVKNKQIHLKDNSAKYALMPVWMLSTRWKNKNYMFAMNGQTGSMIGDLPVSKGRAAGWFFGISGGIFAVFAALGMMLI